MQAKSFLPIVNKISKVLILGSMPGIKSLQEQQYYAHPNNSFWSILYNIFNHSFMEDYTKQVNFLLQNRLALWDSLGLCYREGSLDSNIKKEVPNNIEQLISNFPNIKSIVFNGKAAEKFYYKYNPKTKNISCYSLPSTSPANARFSFSEKLKYWTILKELVEY